LGGAALREFIASLSGKIAIRCGRGSPRAGQRPKHLPGQRGTPRKARELGEQALTRCGSIVEDLGVLAQGRPAMADATGRVHDGPAVGDVLRKKPGETRCPLLCGF